MTDPKISLGWNLSPLHSRHLSFLSILYSASRPSLFHSFFLRSHWCGFYKAIHYSFSSSHREKLSAKCCWRDFRLKSELVALCWMLSRNVKSCVCSFFLKGWPEKSSPTGIDQAWIWRTNYIKSLKIYKDLSLTWNSSLTPDPPLL